MSSPTTYPAHRLSEPVDLHYLGEHPARHNVISLRRLHAEIAVVLARFDQLNAEKRKPNLQAVPSTGGVELTWLERTMPVAPKPAPIVSLKPVPLPRKGERRKAQPRPARKPKKALKGRKRVLA